MTFSEALEEMKKGQSVRRKEWDDLILCKITIIYDYEEIYFFYNGSTQPESDCIIEHEDILANDWEVAP